MINPFLNSRILVNHDKVQEHTVKGGNLYHGYRNSIVKYLKKYIYLMFLGELYL